MSIGTIARDILLRVGRPLVLKRRLPRSFGRHPIYVTPATGLRYFRLDLRRVDPFLCAIAERFVRPGDTVWDVGANIGLFSFCAAARVGPKGRVVALEPDVDMVRLLLRSSAANTLNVEVVPSAVTDRVGFAQLEVAARARAANAIAGHGLPRQMAGVAERRVVPTTTLDALIGQFGRPSFVKIDVEGSELAALRGASRLLREVRPTIACEVADRNENTAGMVDAVTRILVDAGYDLFEASADGASEVPATRATWNTIAIHPARAEVAPGVSELRGVGAAPVRGR